jgi:hypothetical protein
LSPDLHDLPNIAAAAFAIPDAAQLRPGANKDRPRILMLDGSLHARSFSRFLTQSYNAVNQLRVLGRDGPDEAFGLLRPRRGRGGGAGKVHASPARRLGISHEPLQLAGTTREAACKREARRDLTGLTFGSSKEQPIRRRSP